MDESKSGLVYLAGPITSLSYGECTGWRGRVRDILAEISPGIRCLSPLRSKEYLMRERVIRDSYDEHVLSTAKAITCRDRWDVSRCDVLLVNLLGAQRVSIGTVMEIAWADAYRKPVVLVMEKDNIHEHAMINEVCGYRVDDLEVGARLVAGIL